MAPQPTNAPALPPVESWANFTHNKVTYDLSHLNAYTTTYERPQVPGKPVERYTVRVTFSHHCFAAGLPLDGEPYDPTLRYDHLADERIFHPRRWELSKRLRDLLASLAGKKCLNTRKGNFLSINMLDENGAEVRYEIYFRTWEPARGRVHLHVDSAYVRDPSENAAHGKGSSPPKDVTGIAFFTILHNTLNGIPIRP